MKEIQIIAVFAFLSFAFILFVNLDYTYLIDPRYYTSAAVQSVDFESAIQSNKPWLWDFLFVFLISLLGLLSMDEGSVFVFFVLLHFVIILCITLSMKNQKLIFLFTVCSICNLSFVTGVLNVWRQSLAELIFLLYFINLSKRKSTKILFLSSLGFHHITTIYFYSIAFISSKGWRLYVPFFVLTFGLYFLTLEYINLLQAVVIYSNIEHNNNYNRIAVIFILLVVGLITKPKNIHSTYLVSIIFVIFLSNLALYQIAPSATNRLLRIVFTIFPAIYLFSSTGREIIISSTVLVLYLVLNIALISLSSTYNLMYFL